jgi:hypothetical protein
MLTPKVWCHELALQQLVIGRFQEKVNEWDTQSVSRACAVIFYDLLASSLTCDPTKNLLRIQ